MKVAKVCTKAAVTVSRSAPLSEVAQAMRASQVGTVVVTASPADRPVVVGIITDRDIVRAQLQRVSDLQRLSAAEVMTQDPLVLNEDDSIEHAIKQLRGHGVRRAPVIDASGKLVGLVSTDDVLAELCDELANLAELIARQARKARPPIRAARYQSERFA